MKPIALASSLSRVMPSRIREIADIAFTMNDVLRLHFGESNVPTPQYIKDAATQAMNEGYTFYSENAGLPGLPVTTLTNHPEKYPSIPSMVKQLNGAGYYTAFYCNPCFQRI